MTSVVYVDGTSKVLVSTIMVTTDNGASQEVNPEYDHWLLQDQLVLSALLSSLTVEILAQVIFLPTVCDIWVALKEMFGSQSRARVIQIRMQLTNLYKGDMSMQDYFRKAKGLADTMTSIGNPLKDEKVISYLLVGLGDQYDSLVTSMTTCSKPMTLNDLYAHLMTYEVHKEHNNASLQIGSSANNIVKNNQKQRSIGCAPTNNGGRNGGNGGRDHGHDTWRNSNIGGNTSWPTC